MRTSITTFFFLNIDNNNDEIILQRRIKDKLMSEQDQVNV